jgi:hypothetical protein
MNLLSGLEKFGFKCQADEKSLFDDEGKSMKEKEVAATPSEAEKKTIEHSEEEFLLDKSAHCPVCDTAFKTRAVKSGRARRLQPDQDLRPRFAYIDTNKYDVISCPNCGYSAMSRYFPNLTPLQIKQLREGVQSKFKPAEAKAEKEATFSYATAIERYKLALFSAVVKKAKASEKAYTCLKISWLYRGWIEEREQEDDFDEQQKAAYRKDEKLYYEQAYEGFVKAIASEEFPISGMDESTLNLLMASMAYRLENYDHASRFVSQVLTSKVASASAKDRAMDLKEEIVRAIRKKNTV